jgi:hypothetical protein
VHFQEGRKSLEDDPRPVRPVSARSSENVEKVRAIVMQDRRITTTLLAERLGVGQETARQILEWDLQKREICSRFVLHCEAVSCFQIDLCDPASPLLARLGTGPKVKLALWGGRYSDISDIQGGVTEQLEGDSFQDFERAFEGLYKRCQRCMELGEGYIEIF